MIRTDHLHEFVAVVEAGSISAAARILDLPRSTLSRRVSALEKSLHTRLLHRSTRRLVPTPAGAELYQRGRRVVADTQAAWQAVRQLDGVPRGPLRVSVADARTAASRLFVKFAKDFPEVTLEVSTSSRHVDMVAEGVDVALRFGPVADPALISRRLWTSRSIAVASSAFVEDQGLPQTPSELAIHDCVVGFAGETSPARLWPLLNGETVPVKARFASNDIDLQKAAARHGVGIALLPEPMVRQEIAAGELTPILPDSVGAEVPASLVFVDREFIAPQAREFIDRAVVFYRRQWPHDQPA